jgi:4-hydroxybenzoate polyprenyltransferase
MKINNYLKLVKFSHTLFAMPFALASFFMAISFESVEINGWLLLWVILAMVFARNAAMAFNRYADRRYDAANPRTAQREIPTGVIAQRAALLFVIVNALLFSGVTYLINPLCFALSPIALLVILGYSITKRYTALCHLILGVGLGLAPVGAWLAVTASFHLVPILLGTAVVLWVAGFDIIYALQDEAFDRREKLRSIPVAIGTTKALALSSILHMGAFASMVSVVLLYPFHLPAYAGTALFGLVLLYQHLIVSAKDLSRINMAFFTTNGIGSLVWGLLVITDLYFA